MVNSRTRTVVAAILFLFAGVSGALLLTVVRYRDGKIDDAAAFSHPQDPLSEFAAELAEITNSITCAFHKEDRSQSHIIPYANTALEYVEHATNSALRLVVSRHLTREVLGLNLTNANYYFRWQNVDAAIDSICYADRCLEASGAPEMERCEFIFDALVHFKEGALFTLDELRPQMVGGRTADGKKALDADGKPLKFYPPGDKSNCAHSIELSFQHTPGNLCNSLFRFMYPKLSPEAQAYFKKRFKEVFGIGYIPYKLERRAYIEGEEGARWDGKGLKWRIWDGNGNSYDAEPEY